MLRLMLALIAGAAVPVFVYRQAGWWLNSGDGVRLESVLLFVFGAAVTIGYRHDRPLMTWWFPAAFVAIGAIVTSTALLFWTGPGTIFPIVLVFVQIICTLASLGGAAVVNGPALWRHGRFVAIRWADMLLGAAAYLAVQVVVSSAWVRWSRLEPTQTRELVGSGVMLIALLLAFGAVAAIAARAKPRGPFRSALVDAFFTATGGALSMTAWLVARSQVPGEVIPITIVFGLVPLIAGSLAGASLGWVGRNRNGPRGPVGG